MYHHYITTENRIELQRNKFEKRENMKEILCRCMQIYNSIISLSIDQKLNENMIVTRLTFEQFTVKSFYNRTVQ